MFNAKSPHVLNAEQVAELLGISRRQFDAWMRDGTFPIAPLPLPGWRRWSKARVLAFLDGERQAS